MFYNIKKNAHTDEKASSLITKEMLELLDYAEKLVNDGKPS